MRRVTSIILALAFLALGSGAAQRVHLSQHEREHSSNHASRIAGNGATTAAGTRGPALAGDDEDRDTDHHEADCTLCKSLHLPIVPSFAVTMLIGLGLLAVHRDVLPRLRVERTILSTFNSRGPPAW